MSISSPVEQELLAIFQTLTADQQQSVLRYAHDLRRPRGISGAEAVRIAAALNFDSSDLAEMAAAIEAACEQIAPAPEVDLDG